MTQRRGQKRCFEGISLFKSLHVIFVMVVVMMAVVVVVVAVKMMIALVGGWSS